MPESSGPKDRPGFFRLLIRADLAELPKARLLMGEVGQQAGLPAARIFDLQVSVSEATANAIEHAASEVELEAWVLADRVIVEVTNGGVFQPGLYKDGGGRRRGLGLPLMVSLADHVQVSRLDTDKTQVSLTFFLEGYRHQVSGSDVAGKREIHPDEVEGLYRNLVELSPDAILVHVDGVYVFVNPAAAKLFGACSPDELIGLRAVERLHPDDRELMVRRRSRALAGGIGPPVEGRMLRLDGTPISVESTGSRVQFGKSLGVQAIIRDISERKWAEQERERLLAEEQVLNEELAAANEELASSGEELAAQTEELLGRERALRESEERLRSVLDSSLDGLYRLNLQTGSYDYLSPAVGPIMGHSSEEFARLSPEVALRLVHPDDLPQVLEALGQTAAAAQVEYRIAGVDGEYRWISNHFSQVTDANGRPLYRQGVVHDITGRKRAEEVLRETTGRHSSVLENMSEGLMIFDADRNLIFQNPAAARIHGYRVKQDGRIAAEELASTWEGWDEEGHPVAFDEWPLSRVTRGQCFQDMVLHVRRAETGHEFWASYNGCPIYDRDGRILHGFITITDITERYRVEKELRRKEEEARLLLRGAPAAICEIDLRGPRFASVNDWICEQTGYSREELVEMTPYALLDEESQARFRQRMQLALAGGSPEEAIEYTAITKDGRKISAELNISVIYEGGKPTRALVVGHDVTQRKRVERELEEGRKKYQTLIELNADFVWEMDAQGRYTYCSPQMEQLWGLKPDDMIGRTPFEFLPQAEREAADRLLAELVQGDAPFSGWESASHDGLGNLVFLELRGVPIHDESGTVSGLRGTTRDVTERKLAEEALRKSEERFRLMFERHGAVMLLIDPATGAIVDGNAAATRFYGCSRDELCALSIHDLNQLPPEQVAAEYRKAAAEERSHFVFPHAVAGGETRWVDVHSVPIEVQGENLLFSIIQDITERKRAEEDLQRSEEQQSFLLDLSDTVRSLEDPMELQAVAARALGERLAVDRVFYADVIAEDDGYYLVIERGYHAPGLSDVHGRIPMSLYSDRDNREYRAGRTVWSSDVDADPKVTASERRAYQANKTRSYVGVPIIKQRRLVAVLGIVHGAPREWRPGEITFAERAADRIWRELERARAESGLRESEERYRQLAADNERLYRQQLDIAETLQGALLDIPSELGSVHIGHLYRSATEQARVGGDFYDVFQAKEGRIALLIGDVSGHGLEAARVATLVKDIVHAFAHQFRRPQLVLREANRLLVEKNLPGFVTAFLGFLDPDTGTLVYSSAGHPPPLLLADGQAEPLTSASLPLGVFGDARYHDLEIDVPKGARLLLYTDGLTEARRNGDFFGETRLAEALVRERATRIEELPSLLLDEALHFSGGTLVDDVALLAVSFPGGMGGEER